MKMGLEVATFTTVLCWFELHLVWNFRTICYVCNLQPLLKQNDLITTAYLWIIWYLNDFIAFHRLIHRVYAAPYKGDTTSITRVLCRERIRPEDILLCL